MSVEATIRQSMFFGVKVLALFLVMAVGVEAAPPAARAGSKANAQSSASKARKASATKKKTRTRKRTTTRRRPRVPSYVTSSYAQNQTSADVIAGEDPTVRAAAVEALGNMNGSIVAIDPESGRILTMVNQKLALSAGAIPCSTIKIPVALAALNEGVVNQETEVALSRRVSMNLSKALAVSNNTYFEILGRQLGFQKVAYYARQFGLGEHAGYGITGEKPGTYPVKEISASRGGVGRMCSFGEGISVTPLQLGALVSALANNGTLYYLQHPHTADEAQAFTPKVKRYLDIAPLIPHVQNGMRGAVDYGTAR
ncbi:MAG: penicillin-binding transpeptidase domain-containing protein, partial [Candidatus Korobacteraceae bacterium]